MPHSLFSRRNGIKALLFAGTGLLLLPPIRRRLIHRARLLVRGEQPLSTTVEELRHTHGTAREQAGTESPIPFPPKDLLLLGLKQEQRLEVYGRASTTSPWVPLRTYPFTATSGSLGPKLREGDRQIPEGFYGIGYLNPNSSYHLSMQVTYPNDADLTQARKDGRTNPGSDIMIHGSNVTIGCIPIGNDAIEELFLLVADSGIKHTKVWIAPHDLRTHPEPPPGDWPDWVLDRYTALRDAMKALPQPAT